MKMFKATTEKFVKTFLLLHYNCVSKYYNAAVVRCFSNINKCPDKEDECSDNFLPFIMYKRLSGEVLTYKYEEENQKQLLVKELLEECGLDKFSSTFEIQNLSMINMKINELIQCGIIKDYKSLLKRMVDCFRPFKFDENIEDLGYNNEIIMNESIASIRDYLEAKYLCKTLDISYEKLMVINKILQPTIYIGRSIGSTIKKLNIINEISNTSVLNVKDKLYLINMVPFNTKYISKYNSKVLGTDWFTLIKLYPCFMSNSYVSLNCLFNVLKREGFTDLQILEAVSVLKLRVLTVFYRLFYLMTPSSLLLQNDKNFLKLLNYSGFHLSKLRLTEEILESLVKVVNLSNNRNSRRFNTKQVKKICQFLGGTNEHIKILQRHPQCDIVTQNEVYDTILCLIENDFSFKEILDSITIILYSRANILQSFNKISESTLNFSKTTSTQSLNTKILQLCLYYIEKEHNFNGSGVVVCNQSLSL